MSLPLTKEERSKIYLDIMFKLLEINMWDSPDIEIKKFKIMMKLYLDYGEEFQGSVKLESEGDRRLIYEFYNTKKKKTVAYISNKCT